MNVESLTSWLEAIGVPPEVISIDVEADNAWCLLRTKRIVKPSELEPVVEPQEPDAAPPMDPQQAKDQQQSTKDEEDDEMIVAWEVFWREQGNRYDWAGFTNEQVACHYLFGRLAWSQVARGAVGLLPEKPDTRSPVDQAAPAAR